MNPVGEARPFGRAVAFGGVLFLAQLFAGCGQIPASQDGFQALFVSDCPDESGKSLEASEVVLIDWTGGASRIYPESDLPGLDFAAFKIVGGGTLADDEESFTAAVRAHVAALLCDFPVTVSVRSGEGPAEDPFNVVYVTNSPSQKGPNQIGEGEYDVCNEDHDDDAILFGKEMEQLGGPFTFDEWVTLFGNVIAHEIGHLLGFGHVAREETDASEHGLYVELMLAVHTLDEMLSDQRFFSDITNCPDDAEQARRIAQPPTVTCGNSAH